MNVGEYKSGLFRLRPVMKYSQILIKSTLTLKLGINIGAYST